MNLRLIYPTRFPVIPSRVAIERKTPQRLFENGQLIARFGQWLEVIGRRPNTRKAYVLTVAQFATFLQGKTLTSVETQDVRAFLANLFDRELSSSTIATKLFSLRVFYDFLHLGNQVSTTAPRYVQTRKVPRRLPQALSEEEMTRLIGAARNTRDLAIIELGYASGLRVNELASLRVEDVNLRSRTLIVREGKGGNDRLGIFGKPAANVLRLYLGDRTEGRVFQQLPREQHGGVWWDKKHHIWFGQWRETDETGKRVMRTVRLGDFEIPNRERARIALADYLEYKLRDSKPEAPTRGLTARQLWRIIADTARRAGIKHVHPHMLRHTCGTHCLNHDMDVRFVQELLGHATPSTTAKYLHVAINKLCANHTKFHPHGGEE